MSDSLLHNPIADLPGPLFLAVYAVVILALVAEAIWRRSRRDDSLSLEVPKVPAKPDPHAIAYLRGGEKEVARLVVYDLIRRGHLVTRKTATGTRIGLAPTRPPDVAKQTPWDRDAIHFFRDDRTPRQVFQPNGLVAKIGPHLGPIRDALRDETLIPPADRWGATRQWAAASGLILLVGGYKLAVALAKGHGRVGLLLIMGVLGLTLLAVFYRVPRRTRRGELYMARLREAYVGLQARVASSSRVPASGFADPAFVLVPAVFGVSALAGGPLDEMATLFKDPSLSGGGCGSGCGGGSGGDGGGCGGGCGGCGS